MYTREELYQALWNFNTTLPDLYSQMSAEEFDDWFEKTYPPK